VALGIGAARHEGVGDREPAVLRQAARHADHPAPTAVLRRLPADLRGRDDGTIGQLDDAALAGDVGQDRRAAALERERRRGGRLDRLRLEPHASVDVVPVVDEVGQRAREHGQVIVADHARPDHVAGGVLQLERRIDDAAELGREGHAEGLAAHRAVGHRPIGRHHEPLPDPRRTALPLDEGQLHVGDGIRIGLGRGGRRGCGGEHAGDGEPDPQRRRDEG